MPSSDLHRTFAWSSPQAATIWDVEHALQTLELDCPFSAALDLAKEYLRKPIRLRLCLGQMSLPVARAFGHTTLFQDDTDPGRRHSAMRIRVEPDFPRFPPFSVVLRVRPNSLKTDLLWDPAYETSTRADVPLRNWLLGHVLLWPMVANFVSDLRRSLEAEWKQRLADWDSAAEPTPPRLAKRDGHAEG